MVEHVVPLLGIEIAPVTPEGAGLMPGDTISVAPRGMPVGETAEPAPNPSGEVASMVGVGLAIPVTCAMATLQKKSVGMTAATSEYLIGGFRFPIALLQRAPIDLAMVLLGGRLSDIACSLGVALEASQWSASDFPISPRAIGLRSRSTYGKWTFA